MAEQSYHREKKKPTSSEEIIFNSCFSLPKDYLGSKSADAWETFSSSDNCSSGACSSMGPDFRAATGISVQKLSVHNRRSTGWASPLDLMFLYGFTQQAPAGFSEKSVMSRRDLRHSHPPQLQRRTSILGLIAHYIYVCVCALTYACTHILHVYIDLHIQDRNKS